MIVGIAVDFREDVLKFVQETPLEYPLLIGEEDGLAAAEAFGMGMAFPFSVFVDSQNRILTVKIGELHEDEANFAFDRIRDIDNGILTREAAQAMVADAFRQMAADRAKSESAAAAKHRQIGRFAPDCRKPRTLPANYGKFAAFIGPRKTRSYAVWRDSYYSMAPI